MLAHMAVFGHQLRDQAPRAAVKALLNGDTRCFHIKTCVALLSRRYAEVGDETPSNGRSVRAVRLATSARRAAL
jgi:hypothetical protein